MARKRANRPRLIPVSELLRSHAALAECLERQRRADGTLARVRDLLGPAARAHCLKAGVTERVLTLELDSPSWATRVRYQAPDLLAGLADLGLSQVQIRTRPEGQGQPAQRQSPLRLPRLAPTVVLHLLAAAEGCADPAIAQIYQRLARRQGAAAGGRLEVDLSEAQIPRPFKNALDAEK